MQVNVDISKVTAFSEYLGHHEDEKEQTISMYKEAKEYLEFYDWCGQIEGSYVGMFHPGIIGIFLFKILPTRPDVDEWVWVIVGDLPPTYLTCEDCPNPATALDAYIGAMSEWVDAAENGQSVADLIPVNVPATPESADLLRKRLQFLDERILNQFAEDLREH